MIQNIQAKLFPTLLNIKEVFAVLVLGAVVVAIVTGMLLLVAAPVVVVVVDIQGWYFCALNIGAVVAFSFVGGLKVHISVSDAYHRRTK